MNRIGRYELGPILGEGGSGRVYRATLFGPGDLRLPVALKVLLAGGDELRREARIGGLLRHRNLVDVYEVGEIDGTWFAALELCDGTLAEHAPLPERAVVEVALQVCAALAYAHEELGLVHLDLKPGNLLLDDGVVKVGDLGISRAEGFEGAEEIRGTPAFMAPEQLRGDPVDARTDIYALGRTLAALGGTAAPGAPETLALDDLDAPEGGVEWPEPRDGLAMVISRCTARDPESRYPDMAALAAALRALEPEGAGLREAIGWTPRPLPSRRRHTNLDPEPAPVGRDSDTTSALDHLDRGGLVTLKGPAGIGKTTLARAVGRAWAARGAQAWFVELSEVRERADLAAAVAGTLGFVASGGVDQVADALAHRGNALLILDNFEQILSLADVVVRWRDAAPELRVLVTSREPLRVDGEQVQPIGPLDPTAAAELVVARARERGVDLTEDLGDLVERLDGVPLALELAAGRLGVLGVDDVLERLDLSLLRAGSEGRHATLEAAIDWSWSLLSEPEQAALGQLSVFAGDFSVADAEAVLEVDAPFLATIDALIDRSMVQATGGRLRLLHSVRAFAALRLDNPADTERRHGQAFARYGTEDALAALRRHGGNTRRLALQAELDNIVAACRRAVGRADGSVATACFRAAWAVIEHRGPYELAAELARDVLSLGSALGDDRGLALQTAARVARQSGDVPTAQTRVAQALELARDDPEQERAVRLSAAGIARLAGRPEAQALLVDLAREFEAAGDLARTGDALLELALVDQRDNPARSAEHLQRALELYRAVGDRRSEGLALGNLAGSFQFLGRTQEAYQAIEQAMAIAREIRSQRDEGIWLGNVGVLLNHLGRLDEARDHYAMALAHSREVGNLRHAASALGNLGTLAVKRGELDEARDWIVQALQTARSTGDRAGETLWLLNLGLACGVAGDESAFYDHIRAALEMADATGQRRLAELARHALEGGPGTFMD